MVQRTAPRPRTAPAHMGLEDEEQPHQELVPAAGPACDEPGCKLAARFVVQQCLGRGASGTVYRARDEATGADVAVKRLTAVDPAALFRFKSEFRALTNLSHPNLLQLYELVGDGSEWLLVMELVDGPNFLDYGKQSMDGDQRRRPAKKLSRVCACTRARVGGIRASVSG